MAVPRKPASGWRERLYVVIFEHHTPAGRAFDVALLVLILASGCWTMTTVGYGDIAPATAAGRMLASLVMILG